MLVELENEIYETKLQHIQIEITGCCNMHCEHCRAANESKVIMPLNKIEKIMKFIQKVRDDDFRLILSGGEPFLYPNICEIIELGKKNDINSIVITTNASLITDDILQKLNDINLKFLCIQVSIDSLKEEEHDKFRGYKGSYKKCVEVLNKIKTYPNIHSSIRMTITPNTLSEVEQMINFAVNKNVDIIGIGSVIPFGNAKSGDMSLNTLEKKKFLEILSKKHTELKGKIDVTSEDPLKFLIDDSPWSYNLENIEIDDCFFGGCTAGVTTINISANGIVTPCAMMDEQIMDISQYDDINDLIDAYCNSSIIKNLFSRKFDGKCGLCKYNRICGGCRAFAKAVTGNYMGSDMSCWKNDK